MGSRKDASEARSTRGVSCARVAADGNQRAGRWKLLRKDTGRVTRAAQVQVLGREGGVGLRRMEPAQKHKRADLHTRAGRRRHKGVGIQAYISSRMATRGCVWSRCCLSHTRRIDAKVSRILLGKAISLTCSHERHGIATKSNGIYMGSYCFSVYSSVTPCSRLLPHEKVSCRSVHSDIRQTLCRALRLTISGCVMAGRAGGQRFGLR